MKDTYKKPITLNFPNMTVRVFHPDITEEEKHRRLKTIEKAAISLLLSKGR